MKTKQKNEQLYELKKKKPGVAAALSLLLVGAGSMYNGKVGYGFMQLFICFALWFLLMGWIMWIASPIIAYREAKKANELLRLELDLD